VGYAARQISSRAQLERLMTNPPVAAGLAVSPAEWLAVGPCLMACGQCGTEFDREKVSPVLLCMLTSASALHTRCAVLQGTALYCHVDETEETYRSSQHRKGCAASLL
jgi:hypothetical protein